MPKSIVRLCRAKRMPISSGIRHSFLLMALLATLSPRNRFFCHGFSTRATSSAISGVTETTIRTNDSNNNYNISNDNNNNNNNNILILDHINMNHGKGRHDWLKSFYGEDFLGCAWDPRKAKNLETGRKTLWANLGAHQFHLPEGSPDAQVLDGVITIVHPSSDELLERYSSIREDGNSDGDGDSDGASCLNDSLFRVEKASSERDSQALIVTDPWGSVFRVVPASNDRDRNRDPRGSQPGEVSEGCAISDLTIHVPIDANLEGIGRFYEEILGATLATNTNTKMQMQIQIQMGPFQTLTFVPKESVGIDAHVDLRENPDESESENKDAGTYDAAAAARSDGTSTNLCNYGVHISLYVADLPSCYEKAHSLGLAYVNTRFSRRAYTLEEAKDDCMFRCLDIVDPLHPEDGPILRLEHEVRSVVKQDGSKYKSCPFNEIPEGCVV